MNNQSMKIPAITLGTTLLCVGTIIAINGMYKLHKQRKSRRNFVRVHYLYTKEFE